MWIQSESDKECHRKEGEQDTSRENEVESERGNAKSRKR